MTEAWSPNSERRPSLARIAMAVGKEKSVLILQNEGNKRDLYP